MHILNVNHLLDPVSGGGTAERTFQMSRYLATAGVDCSILTTSLGLTTGRCKSLSQVKVISFPCLSERFFVPRVSYNVIKSHVKNADIVHLMGHWTVLNALVYKAACQTGKPYVVCPAGALAIYGRSTKLKRIYNFLVGDQIIDNAAALIAVTQDEVLQFRARGFSLDKIRHIPNGIDQEAFTVRDDTGFRDRFGLGSAPIILFLGRLNHIKGPDLLLQAFIRIADRFPKHILVFAGPDGGMEVQLRDIVHAEGCRDRVRFIGYVGGTDKSLAYNAAELLVIPSRQEAMSIVVLEAGAAGTPVLLTDQCGFNAVETVKGGKVVDASVDGLSHGLTEMLASSPQFLAAMGENLKYHVHENFAWDIIVKKYLDLYESILASQ